MKSRHYHIHLYHLQSEAIDYAQENKAVRIVQYNLRTKSFLLQNSQMLSTE